jgi:UDP-2,4-diacetamido-2,4,6-trideoxy-beta-L-altropyranose hydrolase
MNGIVGALFRVNAGPDIGLGHLQRCLSLAAALQRAGSRCVFLICRDAVAEQRVRACGFDVAGLDGVKPGDKEDLKQTLEASHRHRCGAIVVDSYDVDGDYLAQLRRAGLFVVAIDDLARFPFPCQVVVNGSAGTAHLPYVSAAGDTVFLIGTEFVLLGQDFHAAAARIGNEAVHELLVTVGGSDRHGLMPQLLSQLDDLPAEVAINAVVGPFFENRADVEDAARRCRRTVRLIDGPASIRDLMLRADVAVSGGGQTLYELAATGTPTVAFEVDANQSHNLDALAAEGVLLLVEGPREAGFPARVSRAVMALIGCSDERKRMSAAGRRVVDGQGATRLAKTIIDLYGQADAG